MFSKNNKALERLRKSFHQRLLVWVSEDMLSVIRDKWSLLKNASKSSTQGISKRSFTVAGN